MTKPRECPFCGAVPERRHTANLHYHQVRHHTGCFLQYSYIYDSTIDAWNRLYTDAVATEQCKVTNEVME